MFNFIEPKVECEEISQDRKFGRFVVEPLEGGYGVTVGNSLRRVLLSSLTGAAVTRVNIDGVLHEFTTIPNVREDVTDILLNVKALVVAAQPRTEGGPYRQEGPRKSPPRYHRRRRREIMNPEIHIADLDTGARLFMELTVEEGRGYVTAEANKIPGQPIGVIAMDARFTPVTKVNYSIEATRVGQRTDYDRLVLEIWTDGSVRPDEALENDSGLLIQHFELFRNLSEYVMEEYQEEEPGEKSEVEKGP